jgi:hypothetical protein
MGYTSKNLNDGESSQNRDCLGAGGRLRAERQQSSAVESCNGLVTTVTARKPSQHLYFFNEGRQR